ncbi:glycoside hydrolase family 3 protein [Spelaeicoccus albus]|uniref:beta-N-acetylhexosaminidase n=1 Tax=Spelaeicoccus albus TaxID=1280376 RepID=A0A7Z0AA70_9MICO|nr:glycoside hydrolase family 3 protein [Spelaeicoccus albus]NYI66200.1 beta-N-acetylhexosaminidase [Spelaeicoccus albus]
MLSAHHGLLALVLTVPIVAGGIGAAPAVATRPGLVSARSAARAPGPRAELEKMTLAQRVGQLLMVGTPAGHLSNAAKKAVTKYHAGSIYLEGRDRHSIAAHKHGARNIQKLATKAATANSPMYIAVDQEGGEVQVLQGKGFSDMPTALHQGTWYNFTIKSHAKTWGSQLRRAGVNLNLAPVMDTVSKHLNRKNKPIGYYHREFGHPPHKVAMKGTAFANGMRAAGEQVAIKHFPGLGRVRRNTDTSSGVRDRVTTRHGSTVKPFEVGVKAGAQFVMISSAYYNKIDKKHPGVFSYTIMHTMLREDLNFTGVEISDDLGRAKQVAKWSPGERAVDFIKAGGNMILTAKPSQAKPMTAALIHRAKMRPHFRSKINTSALKVLAAKHRAGLDP